MTEEDTVQFGIVGAGRMGANIARRAARAGHACVAYDVDANAVSALAADGVAPAASLAELIARLPAPRVVWLMLPAGLTEETLDELRGLLVAGDIVIDGGNSNFRDDIRRARSLARDGIEYIDIGTSGGVHGLERGYCLMVGGSETAVGAIEPLLRDLAPGLGGIERTPGRGGEPAPEELGYLHCGPAGAGHFVKMVHNGIEYGMMAAFAEGFNLLANADAGDRERERSAEVSPLEDPDLYRFDIDTSKVAELWRRGSVVSSWLLDLTAQALQENPELDGIAGRVSDSGEGRWTVQSAIDVGVPVPVLAASLFSRFSSRGEDRIANQLLSAMRMQFGGHREMPTAASDQGSKTDGRGR